MVKAVIFVVVVFLKLVVKLDVRLDKLPTVTAKVLAVVYLIAVNVCSIQAITRRSILHFWNDVAVFRSTRTYIRHGMEA